MTTTTHDKHEDADFDDDDWGMLIRHRKLDSFSYENFKHSAEKVINIKLDVVKRRFPAIIVEEDYISSL